MDYFCLFHLTRYNSTTHQPIALRCETGLHLNCKQATEEEKENNGCYRCIHCNREAVGTYDDLETIIALRSLQIMEIVCHNHKTEVASFFCRKDKKAYCELQSCKHAETCCVDNVKADFTMEIEAALAEVAQGPSLPIPMKRLIENTGQLDTLQEKYDLLQRVINYQEEKTWMCTHHNSSEAAHIHLFTLEFGCHKCYDVEVSNYLSIKTENKPQLIGMIRANLKRVHCYDLSLDTLRSLQTLEIMTWTTLLDFAEQISQLPHNAETPVPSVLICPKCLQPKDSLEKLYCKDITHGLCTDCIAEEMKENIVNCPLDHMRFGTRSRSFIYANVPEPAGYEEKRHYFQPEHNLLHIPNQSEIDPDEPEYGPFASEEVRKFPGWRGTKLPAPTLMGPDFKVLSRFFAVYPPKGVPISDLSPGLHPWFISQEVNQIEAVSLYASSPITLTGMTLGCPVDRFMRMTLDMLQIMEGQSTAGQLHTVLLTSPVEIDGGQLACDIRFARPSRIEACTIYTLMLRLRANSRAKMDVYKGNQFTAKEFFMSEGVDFWQFLETETPGFRTNGKNEISGPILRLFYRT